MKGSRWPHTVVVRATTEQRVFLACTGCNWTSPTDEDEMTASRVALEAWDHRRAMRERA